MFSASTCLTYNGTTPLGPIIEIYSNYDSYATLIISVPLTDITPPNCPYILLLPNGTTIVKLYDPVSNCACFIPVNDLCESCDINFSQYSSDTVSLISVGNVTGSCDPSITDYKITWYGPGVGSTTVAFTSGSGATFAPYDYVHPLTGTSAVLVGEGVYTPVLETIDINGTIFSNTGGTGTIYASLDCLTETNVSVSAFTCDNGTMVDNYIHSISFLNAGGGNFPQPMSATFRLSSGVKYFAWKFKGFAIPDKLRLTFSGTNYSDPIYLEYFEVSSNTPTNFNDNVWPKSATTSGYLSKVTCLTGFTITDDDFITIEITPNTTNLQTNFALSCTCLFDFNCDTCIENNTPYKIVLSDISYPLLPCDVIVPTFYLSGCSLSANNTYDLFKYYQTDILGGFLRYNIDCSNIDNKIKFGSKYSYQLYWNAVSCAQELGNYPIVCATPGTGVISFTKSIPATEGFISMSFSLLSDLETYVNGFNSMSTSYSGTPYNSLDINYYRYYTLRVPNGSTCGDGTPVLNYFIHPSTVMITGGTGPYTMTLTMPIISYDLTFNSCDINCENLMKTFIVDLYINSSSTATTNNITFTSTTSSKYTIPWDNGYAYSGSGSNTSISDSGSYLVYVKLNENHPSSGTSYDLIPSLSSITCNDLYTKMELNSFGNLLIQNAWSYQIVLTDPFDITSFEIRANPIVNGVLTSTTFPDVAVIYTAGVLTYANPIYTVP